MELANKVEENQTVTRKEKGSADVLPPPLQNINSF
jgi:hypothetical protein